MQRQNTFMIFSAVLLLLTARGCHSKLMCYVCDNCAKITASSQPVTCDDSFFHSGGTELPSTMTTTEMTTMAETTTTTMESSTTSMMTTTEALKENSTTPITTSTQSTEPPVPTPPTLSPVETTTALPTPPLMGTVPIMMDQMSTSTVAMPGQPMNAMTGDEVLILMNATNSNSSEPRDYMNSSEFRVRQARHVTAAKPNGISYHCYTLQLNTNNTMSTQRGCARVTTPESVCGQLELLASNETSISKCKYCSTNRCNGSSALGISAVTLLIALVASFLKSA